MEETNTTQETVGNDVDLQEIYHTFLTRAAVLDLLNETLTTVIDENQGEHMRKIQNTLEGVAGVIDGMAKEFRSIANTIQ